MRLPAILVMTVLVLIVGCSCASGNPAAQEHDAILAGLSPVHPVKRCGHGDNGKGLDNNAPWFYGYAEVDAGPGLPSRVVAAAAAAGFRLAADPKGEPFDGSLLDPLATQLTGTNEGTKLDVIIAPRPYEASCDVSTTGTLLTPQPGTVILFLGVEMLER